jgi:hypothetical protein
MPGQTKPYVIEIVNGEMVLFDEDGDSFERCRVANYREAKLALRAWTQRYAVRIGESHRRIDEYFANQASK